MDREERLELIHQIEEERNSRILIYITGDRRGLESKISVDTFPFILQHLSQFKHPEKIDLFLYSTGGVTMAGYSLVNLIREFTQNFGVLIPFKALSCATLVALGADDIIMTKMGQLSPIDPSISHPLGPALQIPGGPPGARQVLPLNVEDIFNYIDLAKDELGLKDIASIERVLDILSQKIHPIVLGHAYRSREQISFLAGNLLRESGKSDEEISQIIESITKGRYSHDYIFSRDEAKNILELPIIDHNYLEELTMSLFNEYQGMLELPNPYSPEITLGDEQEIQVSLDRAIIESVNLTHIFRSNRIIRRIEVPIPDTGTTQPRVIEFTLNEGWVEDNTI
jgi:hypothetical protein